MLGVVLGDTCCVSFGTGPGEKSGSVSEAELVSLHLVNPDGTRRAMWAA